MYLDFRNIPIYISLCNLYVIVVFLLLYVVCYILILLNTFMQYAYVYYSCDCYNTLDNHNLLQIKKERKKGKKRKDVCFTTPTKLTCCSCFVLRQHLISGTGGRVGSPAACKLNAVYGIPKEQENVYLLGLHEKIFSVFEFISFISALDRVR